MSKITTFKVTTSAEDKRAAIAEKGKPVMRCCIIVQALKRKFGEGVFVEVGTNSATIGGQSFWMSGKGRILAELNRQDWRRAKPVTIEFSRGSIR